MHWKLKSKIQNCISLLPSSLSYSLLYWIQRKFGGLSNLNPTYGIFAAVEACKRIQKNGYTISDKIFFEIGTGRIPIVPIAYWLMGAKKTITIDLNPYLKKELAVECLEYLYQNTDAVLELFGELIDRSRFDKIITFHKEENFSLYKLFSLCSIEYIAPGDATNTCLPDKSIDFHSSNTVFEHIPLFVLKDILYEGNRIIKDEGLFIHRIDYSDHFAHTDKNISRINFLQYSDDEWERYAGNRYMYMNRLRHDDFLNLFKSVGHNIIADEPSIEDNILKVLRDGTIQLDEKFQSKPKNILSISGAWIISKNSQ